MKSHIRHVTVGGVVGPLALAIGAAIANEAQTLLGLHLQGEALAIFIAPFLLGAAAVLHGQLRLEGQKIGAELGGVLKDLDLGAIFDAPAVGSGEQSNPGPPGVPGPAPSSPPLPPPPPPAP
jgi:hypothetical protein